MELSPNVWIILAGAFATYLTRVSGHLILSRFEAIAPRVEAGLNAVPAAVLTAIVAPSLFFGGIAETLTLVIAAAAALYLPPLAMVTAAWAALLILRAFFG